MDGAQASDSLSQNRRPRNGRDGFRLIRFGIIFSLLTAAASLGAAPARATTPLLAWEGVTSLGVQCVVRREPFRHDADLAATLCARVASMAAEGASVPVTVVALGDPALVAAGRAALLVHASVEPTETGRMLAFSIRPLGASPESAILFGAAPRIVALQASGVEADGLDAAITAALAEVLPWQARPQQAQLLPDRR